MCEIQTRAKLVSCRKQFNRLLKQMQSASKEAIELVNAESDLKKRGELIDFLFADNVNEVIEYHLRKELDKAKNN